jgi:flagellar protein FlbD
VLTARIPVPIVTSVTSLYRLHGWSRGIYPRMGEAMIVLTRLNESTFAVNPDLIERIQASPDTSIVLVDGTTFIVRESVEHVIDLIAGYRAKVIALAHSLSNDAAGGPHRAPHLGVVEGDRVTTRTRKGAR